MEEIELEITEIKIEDLDEKKLRNENFHNCVIIATVNVPTLGLIDEKYVQPYTISTQLLNDPEECKRLMSLEMKRIIARKILD